MKILDYTIPKDLSEEIIEFALHTGVQYFTVNMAGNGRRFCNLNVLTIPLVHSVAAFSKDCYAKLGIDVKEEPMFGNFIGVNSENAFVQPHKDNRSELGEYHVRLNFLVQKPENGGNPIINGIEHEINEGFGWINLASEWVHQSTPVIGKRNRIVLSLGSFVDQSIAQKFDIR